MSFSVSPAAAVDVAAASAAYDRQPGRYGQAFEEEVDAAFARIASSPRQYSPVEDGVPGLEIREFFIERFQQRVIYLVNGEDVLVVAVTHASRREGAWHRNLPTDLPPETT
jgi:plasmid stabilization system protein ParE